MQLTVKVDSKALEKALLAAPKQVHDELYAALAISLRSVTTTAEAIHKYKTKSGQLSRSILYNVEADGMSGATRLDSGVAPYGKYQHDGSKPHEIRAKDSKALHFVMGGKNWFVPKKPYIGPKIKNPFWLKLSKEGVNVSFKGHVDHPGIKPDQFLYRAFNRNKDAIVKRIEAALASAYRKAGL